MAARGSKKDPPSTGLFEKVHLGSVPEKTFAQAALRPPEGWIYWGSFLSGMIRMDTYMRRDRLWTLVFSLRGQQTIETVVSFHSWFAPPYPHTTTEYTIMAKYLKKAQRQAKKAKKEKTDPFFAEKYEALHEYLCLTAWEDGSTRQTSTISLFVDNGQWKARLNDREDGLVAFVAADGFIALLEALESGLRDGTLDWREDRFAAKPKGKKS